MKTLKILCLFLVSVGLIFVGCSKMSPTESSLLSDDSAPMSLAKKGGVPSNIDKKVSKGIYYLVKKDNVGPDGIPDTGDETWAIQPRSTNAFGMGKFSVELGILTMRLVAHKLTPGNWYYVELVDLTSGWNPIDKHWPSQVGDADSYNRFYGQADNDGDVVISFSWNISGHNNIEVNMKNADNVALLEPSTYGVPGEWILGTGQGWDYVLYGRTTIQMPLILCASCGSEIPGGSTTCPSCGAEI